MSSIPGSDASILALLAQGADLTARQVRQLLDALVSPEARRIAQQMLEADPQEGGSDAVKHLREWATDFCQTEPEEEDE